MIILFLIIKIKYKLFILVQGVWEDGGLNLRYLHKEQDVSTVELYLYW